MVQEDLEAGIVLTGAEVKSMKQGQVSLAGSYVTIRDSVPYLVNAHISPYPMASTQQGYQPTHDRKLLLSKKEISSLIGKLKAQGLTLLPISVYTKGSLIKLKIAICRGKKLHDKREQLKKRELDRRLQRVMRSKY